MQTKAPAQSGQIKQNAGAQSGPGRQTEGPAGVVDNRPEAAAQLKQIEMMNNSPRAIQMRALAGMIHKSPRSAAQRKQHDASIGAAQLAPKANNTGLPDNLKSGIESLSDMSMDHVKVHYNSAQPAQLNAHAYAQGSEIHVAPGQERHLPHEAWHVVQQAQGRVKPTMQMKDQVAVNEDEGLEREADAMGATALNLQLKKEDTFLRTPSIPHTPAQLQPADLTGFVTAPSKFAGLGKMFDSWGALETAIESYSILASENIAKRHELIGKITTLSVTWLQEFNRRMQANTPHQQDAPRKILFDRLHPILTQEENEIKATGGKLVASEDTVSANPRLTKKLEDGNDDKDAPEGGMFKIDAPIRDETLKTIDRGAQGKVCKILQGWQAAQKDGNIAKFKAKYHKVEAESQALAAGNFQSIKTGFVNRDNIIPVNRIESAQDLKYKEKTSHLDHPLFAHPPVIEDIVQVGLGDCYLLAAMISVLNGDPGHFVNHLRDNKDGTVTVKLYKDVGQPVIITIRKSIVVKDTFFEKDQTDAFASGALWVKIYEKAYVAAGFHGSGLETLPSAEKSYGMTEGGFGHIAQTHITGLAAKNHRIETGRNEIRPKFTTYFRCPELENKFAVLAISPKGPDPEYDKVMKQFEILNVISGKLEELFSKTFVTTADLTKMLTSEGVEQEYLDIIMDKVTADKLITGPLGAGKYSQKELDLFKSITDDFDAGKKMTIGSRKDIFDSPDEVREKGGSAGESMVKGLVGPHAYAILDYAPKPIVEGKALSLKLRNPWSSYGRKYKKPQELAPVRNETGDTFEGAERIEVRGASGAESWFDLADIAAYFTSFSSM